MNTTTSTYAFADTILPEGQVEAIRLDVRQALDADSDAAGWHNVVRVLVLHPGAETSIGWVRPAGDQWEALSAEDWTARYIYREDVTSTQHDDLHAALVALYAASYDDEDAALVHDVAPVVVHGA